ncbi:MAG: helix-turn-helix transcriptional regulator [Clostridia bacterium]|nr:helix-turn-helix transcriptional regulator [Clostridia bacterium]
MIYLTLDKILTDSGISRYELSKRTGIQYQIIDNYYKNKVKRYDSYVLDKICNALNCNICDILQHTKD